MDDIITSLKNGKVKYIKSLLKKKKRWEEKKYTTEGIRTVEQLLENPEKISEIIFSREVESINRGKEVLMKAEEAGVEMTEVTSEVFSSITMTETPQYIMAVVEFELYSIEDIPKLGRKFIILDRIQDPGNLGTIIRTAEAMGFSGVIFTSGSVDIYNPKTLRSTMGAEIPMVFCSDLKDAAGILKQQGIRIISSYLRTEKRVFDVDMSDNAAIVIGNEANGISEEIISISDELIKIPMIGTVESLNAASASAMLMYESMRQSIQAEKNGGS